MILLTHILIALTSLVITAYAFVSPSQATLRASYALVALTIATGTYVAVANPMHIAQACVSGLVYTGVVMATLVATRRKLSLNRG